MTTDVMYLCRLQR